MLILRTRLGDPVVPGAGRGRRLVVGKNVLKENAGRRLSERQCDGRNLGSRRGILESSHGHRGGKLRCFFFQASKGIKLVGGLGNLTCPASAPCFLQGNGYASTHSCDGRLGVCSRYAHRTLATIY